MLSGSRIGLLATVVSWRQKIIISRSLCLRSSPSHSQPPSLSTSQPFNPVRPIFRVGFSFNSSHCFSPDQCSSSSFNSSSLQQRTWRSRRKYSVNSLLVISVPNFSTRSKTGGTSYHAAPSALFSPLWSSSVILRRIGMGHRQRQRRNRTTRARTQEQNTISVEAIASIDDPETDLNQKNSLHEELERYGVHESDYKPQEMNEHQPSRGSSSMRRKRKATTDLSNGSKQQHTPAKGKSDVVQDWCCYLLLSVDSKKTYVGATFDIKRRLRQHNGEISGGAKSARAGRPWRLVCTVHGFNSRSEACQFEWRWKATAAKYKIIVRRDSETMESPLVTRRRATLAKVLKAQEEWTYLNVQWHAD